jgi:Flp pilus assembly pilin Flp
MSQDIEVKELDTVVENVEVIDQKEEQKKDRGAVATEYVLVVTGLMVIIIVAVIGLRDPLSKAFSKVGSNLESAAGTNIGGLGTVN